MTRTYSELVSIPSFEERYQYLRLLGAVGEETFGFDRIFNQMFYRSGEWKRVRKQIILRDNGCDLAFPGREIRYEPIIIHHLNPITIDDIQEKTDYLLNPEYLICCRDKMHRAIHYGDESLLNLNAVERRPNDTCPWR